MSCHWIIEGSWRKQRSDEGTCRDQTRGHTEPAGRRVYGNDSRKGWAARGGRLGLVPVVPEAVVFNQRSSTCRLLKIPWRWLVPSPFYRWGNWGTEWLKNLPQISQVVSGIAEFEPKPDFSSPEPALSQTSLELVSEPIERVLWWQAFSLWRMN